MAFVERFLRVPPPAVVGARSVKRYHVNVQDESIESDVLEAAYEFLPRLLPPADEDGPAGSFVVVHRATRGAFVNAYSWVWSNVLYCRTAAAGEPYCECTDDDPTNFREVTKPLIGCVWELAPLGHERDAWVRHVLRAGDFEAYLTDSLPEGTVGA